MLNKQENKNLKVVLVDNELNFYGIMDIKECKYKEFYVNHLIKEIIIKLCGNEEEFFGKFSEYISDMLDELSRQLDSDIYFEYYNAFIFNVDEVFSGVEEC